MPEIKLVDLTKGIINKRNKEMVLVLYHLSATIQSGKFNVILGDSGAGKSMLLKTIAGLLEVDSGKILFDDNDYTYSKTSDRKIGYISQEFALYPNQTVFDNISYPLKVNKVPDEEIIKRTNEIIEMLDLKLLSSRKPKHLSGGQQQRVALARALVKNPEVILLDEPLSNIDEESRYIYAKELSKIQKELGITFIYVTHNLNEASILADYIIVINNGEVVQEGNKNDVLLDKEGYLYNNYINIEKE